MSLVAVAGAWFTQRSKLVRSGVRNATETCIKIILFGDVEDAPMRESKGWIETNSFDSFSVNESLKCL